MSKMDDHLFDERIKTKVGGYEDPSFDPGALAALHQQMAAVSIVPWYSTHRTELMIGLGMIISTLIILCSQWLMGARTEEALNEKIGAIQGLQQQIDKLQGEIRVLKNIPPDTIRLVEIRDMPSSHYTELLYRIKLLEAKNTNDYHRVSNSESENDRLDSQFDMKSSWSQNPSRASYGNLYSARLSPRTKKSESRYATPHRPTPLATSNSKSLSTKTLRDMEDHYRKGIGIRLGPTLELGKTFYNNGDGDTGTGGGVLGDIILSPSLSVESGLKYAHRVYNISDEDDLSTRQLPGMDETLGTLKGIDIDSWFLEIPLTLKYRYPVSIKTHWLAGIGYASQIYLKQVLEYEYAVDGNPGVSITTGYESSQPEFYSGMVNFSLGVSNQLKSKRILETSLYYQVGLAKTGIEHRSINYLGVRGVYWFLVR